MSNYLVLDHLHVTDANAQSSPLTIGIPAITAFLGAAHKLQRELRNYGFDKIQVSGVGIIIHDYKLKTYKMGNNECIINQAKPLLKNREGKFASPPIIPDAKIDFTVSLILEIITESNIDEVELTAPVSSILMTKLRIAGGIIQPLTKNGSITTDFKEQIKYKFVDENSYEENIELLKSLIPGYALIERRDLLQKEMDNNVEVMDAFFDYLAIHHDCTKDDKGNVSWHNHRKEKGWIVPISVGYQGITEPTKAKNQRDLQYEHIFAENLITLGEYKIVSSFDDIEQIMWRYDVDLDKSLYRCVCNGGN